MSVQASYTATATSFHVEGYEKIEFATGGCRCGRAASPRPPS